MKRLIPAFLLLLFLPASAFSAPEMSEIRCSHFYNKSDLSESKGVLFDTACVVYFLWSTETYPSLRNTFYFPDERPFVSCKIKKGDNTCFVPQDQLDTINNLIQERGAPRRIDSLNTRYDSTQLERENGCSLIFERRNLIPPKLDNRGNVLIGLCDPAASTCRMEIEYAYLCATLPSDEVAPEPTPTPVPPATPEDTTAFQECRTDYSSCLSTNLSLQLQIAQCRGTNPVSVALGDFSGGLAECSQHLSACRVNNFQLSAALQSCN